MPEKVIAVEGLGNVAFPDSMSDDAIASAIKTQLQPKSKSFGEQLGDVAKGYWGHMTRTGEGMVNAVAHPLDTAKGVLQSNEGLADEASKAFHEGRYADAVRHGIGYVLNGLPGVGATLDEAGNKAAAGNVGEAIGETGSLATQMLGPKLLADHPVAMEVAQDAVKGAAKGATEMVARRYVPLPASIAGAVGGGIAAREIGLPHEVGAAVGAAVPIVRGAIQGVKAGMAARRAPIPIRLGSAGTESATPGDAVAQGLGYESYDKAPAALQQTVDDLLKREPAQTRPPADWRIAISGAENAASSVEATQPIQANINPSEMDRSGPFNLDMLKKGNPGISIEQDPYLSRLQNIVYRDGQGIPQGYLKFYLDDNLKAVAPREHGLYPEVYVSEGLRRKGIATALYDTAKRSGFDLSEVSGTETTPSGAAFLNSRSSPPTGPEAPSMAAATMKEQYFAKSANLREGDQLGRYLAKQGITPEQAAAMGDQQIAAHAKAAGVAMPGQARWQMALKRLRLESK